MPACPATLKDPGTPHEIVLDQHILTYFPSQHWCKVIPTTQLDKVPESAFKMCVESRGRDSPRREQSKIDAVVPPAPV